MSEIKFTVRIPTELDDLIRLLVFKRVLPSKNAAVIEGLQMVSIKHSGDIEK